MAAATSVISGKDMNYFLKNTCLSRDEIEKFSKEFHALAGDSGLFIKHKVSKDDLKSSLSTDQELDKLLINAMDQDKDKYIDLREYLLFASFLKAPRNSPERYEFLFRVFDLNHDGAIKMSEFEKALAIVQRHGLIPGKGRNEPIMKPEEFFKQLDKDHNDKVSLYEFVHGFMELTKDKL